MNDFLDIYTIVFIALAIFVILRLKSVLGERTGNERPPFDPFQRPMPPKPDDGGNVVPLPTAARPAPAPAPIPAAVAAEAPADKLKGIAEPSSELGTNLIRVMDAEPLFEPKSFLMGARAAYEMIVLAFARGDRRSLKDLLSKDVFEGFSAAISEREARGEKVETTFVSIDKSDLTDASFKGGTVSVTVRFVSKMITATRDAAGAVIDGNPEKIVDLVDVWTFSREAGARDPNWRLVSTQSDA
ncbi:MAG TPA: Tim44/TimA family putative adaptor protein [Beijerinckiaceae bacterium]|nr:Tim44/TimA family putative adaptor protein [Beijerinckiaceae bacterium]